MRTDFPGLIIREWETADAPALAENANDRRIWRNLRDRFPHPYGLADAEAFIAMARAMEPRTFFAIALDGRLAGSIGYTRHEDVERVSAEIGYYVAVRYWGRGIATAALIASTDRAFEATRGTAADLRGAVRVEHGVGASAREGGLPTRREDA